ncbi:MAG: antitoxin [bacterium]
MNVKLKKIRDKKFITNEKGEVESIVLPINEYNKIIELIEDYGLGLAMKEAEGGGYVGKEAALKFLDNDKD